MQRFSFRRSLRFSWPQTFSRGFLYGLFLGGCLSSGRLSGFSGLFGRFLFSLGLCVERRAAFFTGSGLFAAYFRVSDAGGFPAGRANYLHIAGIDIAVDLFDTAGNLRGTGLIVLSYDIYAVHNNRVLAGIGRQNLTGFALILSGENEYVVALFNV